MQALSNTMQALSDMYKMLVIFDFSQTFARLVAAF